MAACGLLVNQLAWQFGRLFGLYIVGFFVASQVPARGIFGARQSDGLIAGRSLIVARGLLIQLTAR